MTAVFGRRDRSHPRVDRRGEARLPAVVAVVVTIGLYALLPQSLIVGPRFVVPGLELLLLIPLIAVNPRRLTRQNRLSRVLSMTLVLIIAVANQAALGLLIHSLITVSNRDQGRELLLAAGQVWFTNIIVFGLAFWELDRGGPVIRTQSERCELPAADFRFSQDENDDAVEEVAVGSSGRSDWYRRSWITCIVGDQLDCLQPHGHDAALTPREATDCYRMHLGIAHLGAGDRARRRRPPVMTSPGAWLNIPDDPRNPSLISRAVPRASQRSPTPGRARPAVVVSASVGSTPIRA